MEHSANHIPYMRPKTWTSSDHLTIWENSEDGVICLNKNLEVIFINKSARQLLPHAENNQHFQELIASWKTYLNDPVSAIFLIAPGQPPIDIKIPSGVNQKYILKSVHCQEITSPEPAIFVFLKNSKNAEADNENSNGVFTVSAMINSIDEGYAIIDKSNKIRYFNEIAAKLSIQLLGFPVVIGESALKYIREDLKDSMSDIIKKVLSGFTHKMIRHYTVDAKPEVYEITLHPYMNNEVIEGLIARYSNITEKYKFEKALEDTIERFNKVLKTTRDIVFEYDHLTESIAFNDSLTQILGYTPHEMREGTPAFNKLVFPADAAPLIQRLTEFYKTKENTFNAEHVRLIRKNGSIIHAELTFISIKDEQGNSIKSFGNIKDISERYHAAEEIRRSNERFKHVSELAHEIVWEFELKTGLLHFNEERIFQLYGAKEKSPVVFSEFLHRYLHPDDHDNYIKLIIESGKSSQDIVTFPPNRFIKPNKEIVYSKTTVRLLRDEKGDTEKVIGVTNDITKEFLAEKEIKKSNQRFEVVSKLSHDFIWEYIPATEEMHFNPEQLNDLFGINIPTPYPQTKFLMEYMVPEDIEPYFAQIIKAEMDHESQLEFRISRFRIPSGEILYCKTSCRLFWGTDDRPEKVIGVTSDITKEYLAALEIEKSNERFELAAKASYDLIWERDFSKGIYIFNEALLNNFGYDNKEPWTVDRFRKTLLFEGDSDMVISYADFCYQQQREQFSYPIHRYNKKDGTHAYVDVRVMAIYDKEGKPIKSVGVSRDITNRYKIEDELRKSNERFRLASEASYDMIWDLDMSTGNFSFNEVLTKLWGYKDLQPTNIKDFMKRIIHPDDLELIESTVWNFIKSKDTTLKIPAHRVLKADGTTSYVMVRMLAIRNIDQYITRMIGVTRDINDRYLTEQRLRESNERFELAALASYDMIWDLNGETGFISCGPTITQLFGFEVPEPMHFKNLINKLVHPDDQISLQSQIKDFVQSDKLQKEFPIHRIIKKDGSIAFVQMRALALRKPNNFLSRLIGIVRDVTEKYKNEQQLIENNERFQQMANINFDLLIDIDFKQGKYYVNNIMKDFYGYDPANFSGLMDAYTSILHPDDRAATLEFINKARKGSLLQTSLDAFRAVRKNGEIVYCDLKISYTRNAAGDPIRGIAVVRNVTDRVLAQKVIQDSHERYELLGKATRDIIWEWDVKQNELIFWNDNLNKLLGYKNLEKKQSIEWKNAHIHPDDLNKFSNRITTAFNNQKEVLTNEYRFMDAKGKYHHILDRSFIHYNENGEPNKVTGAMQDITEFRKLQEKLSEEAIFHQQQITEITIQTQEKEREEIGRELNDNINQLLAIVMVYLSVAKSDPDKSMDMVERCTEVVSNSIAEIRKLSHKLISPVLDMGLDEAVGILISETKKQSELSLELITSSFDPIRVPKHMQLMLYRVVQEQLTNVIKHSNATYAEIQIKQNAGQVSVCITDNGEGFEESELNKGVGLRTIMSRAKLYNGKATITSMPGKGTTMEIRVPIKPN